jgi:predicted lipoprotein with Yx(FWY)xxD motif
MAGLVVGLAACSSASQTTPGSAYGTTPAATTTKAAAPMRLAAVLKIEKTKLGDVLANDKGDTLYWYSKDVKGKQSNCTGSCLTAWPAVAGTPVPGSGVKLTGTLGTITRPGGQLQATYNGYPLYTYAADAAAGQTAGNDAGGVWHVITISASATTSPSASNNSGY